MNQFCSSEYLNRAIIKPLSVHFFEPRTYREWFCVFSPVWLPASLASCCCWSGQRSWGTPGRSWLCRKHCSTDRGPPQTEKYTFKLWSKVNRFYTCYRGTYMYNVTKLVLILGYSGTCSFSGGPCNLRPPQFNKFLHFNAIHLWPNSYIFQYKYPFMLRPPSNFKTVFCWLKVVVFKCRDYCSANSETRYGNSIDRNTGI